MEKGNEGVWIFGSQEEEKMSFSMTPSLTFVTGVSTVHVYGLSLGVLGRVVRTRKW